MKKVFPCRKYFDITLIKAKNMTKLSVCITYYNQEEFVKESIESVLNLDLPCELEILAGDDCSTDNTVQIIQEYQQKYPDIVKLVINKKNREKNVINRASLNRLNLVSRAQGEYIMFLDGDDFYCDKTFVKEALDVLKDNEDIAACAFNFKFLHSKKECVFAQKMTEGLIYSREYIAKEYYTPAGAMVFRNTLSAYKLRKLKEINNFDDNGITIYFLQYGDIYYINKAVYTYRQQKNSSWNRISKTEQILLNAMDYKLLYKTAPKFEKEILKREFPALKYIYKNRKKLPDMLGDNLNKYIEAAAKNNDKFIYRILNWAELNPLTKLKIKYKYQKWKIDVKYLYRKVKR